MADNLPTEVGKTDVSIGFGSLQSFELTQRAAKLLMASSLVPKEYQGNLPNCVIALNMATRMGADPLMVMQNLFIVHGRPGWSSQFLIGTFNTAGRFSALRYEWVGAENTDTWGCRAWAIEKSTGERLEGSLVTLKISKSEGWYEKSGSKWKTMPQQMLMYRAASWFIRAYAPELAMGMHTDDEIRDIIDVAPGDYEIKATEKEIEQNANQGGVIDVQAEPEPTPASDGMTDEEKAQALAREKAEAEAEAAKNGKRSPGF